MTHATSNASNPFAIKYVRPKSVTAYWSWHTSSRPTTAARQVHRQPTLPTKPWAAILPEPHVLLGL